MTKRYAVVDSSGFVTAFYSDDCNKNIPTAAINITEAQWQQWILNSQTLAWQNGALIAATKPAIVLTVAEYKRKAQAILNISDRVALRCIKAGVEYPVVWHNYDVALRAIISNPAPVTTNALPTTPPYPAGT